MAELRLRGVSKTYNGTVSVTALNTVTLDIHQADFVAIQGPSGAGKSTLLHQLALLDVPTTGHYLIDDTDVRALSERARARIRSEHIAFIFQSFHLLPGRSVLDNVAFGLLYRGLGARERRRTARDCLTFVGLEDRAEQKVETLSGGERQRCAIARALASGAPVIVADEPTGNLDSHSSTQVMELLTRLNQQGVTIIVVTHDDAVAAYASRHVRVVDGLVTDVDAATTATHHRRLATPLPPGRPSRLRLPDALVDTWQGVRARLGRSAALIASVALAVALATATMGLSTSARFQVSDLFDSRRNQMVELAVSTTDDGIKAQVLSPQSISRLQALAGVEALTVLAVHDSVPVSARPSSTTGTPLPLIGLATATLPEPLFALDSPDPLTILGDDEVILGARAAQNLQIGPLVSRPVVWVEGRALSVVAILTDAGLDVGMLDSIIVNESTATGYSPPQYASARLRVRPGAAQQVAAQGPVAWLPTSPPSVTVTAPPDPATLRAEVEQSVRTVLYTLTAVTTAAALTIVTTLMIASVMERTAEIGLRRAMGARRVHIRGLVALEAALTGVLGGAAGSYIGILSVLAVSIARGWQPVVAWESVPVGIGAGVAVSLMGAIFAAHRASRIEPVDALRH